MPRGVYERKRSEVKVEEELSSYEQLVWTVAEVIQSTLCSIQGCQPKFHLEDANIIVRKMIRLGLVKE